ncbi:hypothetical protein HO173_001496 [Letharia columbiana]|uniref:Uncharacterized protein n=1 Tax=Letharia columbiana TaxID=112416 RepID=A0A8H6G5B1_9LECA|nr:uncharacterized protein HO173_001496 [Letharia columbiana]KAF6240823.1 hypothetical protein HO173_001496 [Letharia columbiana]
MPGRALDGVHGPGAITRYRSQNDFAGHKKFALAALIGNREWRQTSSVLAQFSPSLRPMRSMREEANNDTASWMNRLLRFRSDAPGACLIAGPHTCVEEDGSLSGYDRGTSDSLRPRK